MAGRKKRGVVRGQGGLELGKCGIVFTQEINPRGADSIGFHRGICDREQKKNPSMRECRQDKHGREDEVDAVAVGPLEKQRRGVHFSSEVAITVG